MQTPVRMDAEQFYRELAEWDKKRSCPKCSGHFAHRETYLSVHALEFDPHCVGEGRVARVSIPYCPTCEARPWDSGCIHAPLNRCDFCFEACGVGAEFQSVSRMTATFTDNTRLIDDERWNACTVCTALIKAGEWTRLLDRVVPGMLRGNPQIPDTPDNRAELRRRARAMIGFVLGVHLDV